MAKFIEQPGILNGYDSLLRKVGNKFDLLIREGTHFLTEDDYRTHQFAFLEHGNTHKGADTAKFNGCHSPTISHSEGAPFVRVVNVDGSPVTGDLTQTGFGAPYAMFTMVIHKRRRNSKGGDHTKLAVGKFEQDTKVGLADSRRVLEHCPKHGLKLAGCAADDLKDF